MQIANETAVWLQYTLRNDAGEVLDASEDNEPLVYIHGQGDIVPGLEKALEGKAMGTRFNVTVSPEEGYGVHDVEKTQAVPRGMFPAEEEIVPGMQFHAQGPDGHQLVVTVVKVDDERITVDGNHPLAGVQLNFDVKVLEVRAATGEEITHGHVHGPGGHHHH